MSEEIIAEALGLKSLAQVKNEQEEAPKETLPEILDDDDAPMPMVSIESNDEHLSDVEFAKNNIKNIIEKGDSSLEELVNLAKQSESPRAFEVVSGMMKTLLDANREFVDMSAKKKYAKEDSPASQTNVTNNNLVLSTTDLLKMLKGETE